MKNLLIYLGAPNDANGVLSLTAQERADTIVNLYFEIGDSDIVLTGGKGEHFNKAPLAHWLYVKKKITTMGIPISSIIDGIESSNTVEDVISVSHIPNIDSYECLIFVTSNFHVPRVSFLTSKFINQRYIIVPTGGNNIIDEMNEWQEMDKIKRLISND